MKKILLASASMMLLASSAFAADLQPRVYTKAPPPPPPPPIYRWTGFYIGGHVGGAFNGDTTIGGTDTRFIGGAQVGFDYQFPSNWVIGLEGKYTFTDRNTVGSTFPAGFTINDRNSDLGSVTGRLGYALGQTLLYAKGGVAFRPSNNISVYDSVLGTPLNFADNAHDVGWTVGAGVEYMFSPNWSARAEYQYYNFGNVDINVPSIPTTVSYHPDVHTFTVGLNYRFNMGNLGGGL
jgi:outer membrane immunogenic protein